MIHKAVPTRDERRNGIAPLDGRLERFLFASIGASDDGTLLTVVSALARLGFDPWTEASRLSALPREQAEPALAAIVGSVPPMWCRVSDSEAIVSRLVKLLPQTPPPAVHSTGHFKSHRKIDWLSVICGVLFALVVVGYLYYYV